MVSLLASALGFPYDLLRDVESNWDWRDLRDPCVVPLSARDSGLRRGNNQEEGKKRRYYAAEQKIKKAVDEGKVSAEDGRKRLEGLRKALWPDKREESRGKEKPSRDEYIERVAKRIKMAVEEGKITEEQGAQRMKGFLKRLDEKNREE